MTSVLGLFPVGLNASRNAIAQNCSADVADQMVTYMRVMGESSAPAYVATFETPATSLPTFTELAIASSGETTKIDLKDNSGVVVDYLNAATLGMSEDFLEAYKAGNIDEPGLSANDFMRVAKGWAIFIPKTTVPNLRRRVYFIIQGPNCTEIGAVNRNIDYSAMALVWKSTAQIMQWDGVTKWPVGATDYSEVVTLNIELSWPLKLPYAERNKRYYQVVIARPGI
jgi:hypothetical protein